jgi:YgiT-type zinc finger domain-containing protein
LEEVNMEQDQLQPYEEMAWFGRRIRAGRYSFSEHVVRNMVEGEVCVTGIEAVLTGGRVLEEYRNSSRSTSYLVHGTFDGAPLHVVAAEDANHNLVVLFAYIPGPPVWDSPTKRNPYGGMEMAEAVGICFFCGGKLVDITVGNYFYRYEGQMSIVKNLPATLCEQCGEKYLGAETSKRLNDLIDAKAFAGTEEARVIEFQPEEKSP